MPTSPEPVPGHLADDRRDPRWYAPTRPHVQTAASFGAPVCGSQAPRSAADYQDLFRRLHDSSLSGGDGGRSVALPDGRSLFLFGDSFQGGVDATGGRAAGTRIVRNAMVMLDGQC